MEQQWRMIKASPEAWHALKRVQAWAPERLEPSVRSMRALLDAIGRGDDELLRKWRAFMREGRAR